MKLSGFRINDFLKNPSTNAVLIYGPEDGLIQERSDMIAKTVVPDLSDPFRVVDLTPSDLAEIPSRLMDEALSFSLTGGRRLIRVRDADDSLTNAIKYFLETEGCDNFVLLQAGPLSPKSRLRALFEKAKNAAALPCYVEDKKEFSVFIRRFLSDHHITIHSEPALLLTERLWGNRMLAMRELEKLLTYIGDRAQVTITDVQACIDDNHAHSLDEMVQAVLNGHKATLHPVLSRLFAEGINPIFILRALQNYFHRLHLAQSYVIQGDTVDEAINKLKPPLFFKVKPEFRAQLSYWNANKLTKTLTHLHQVEYLCKKTNTPAQTVCRQFLYSLASTVKKSIKF